MIQRRRLFKSHFFSTQLHSEKILNRAGPTLNLLFSVRVLVLVCSPNISCRFLQNTSLQSPPPPFNYTFAAFTFRLPLGCEHNFYAQPAHLFSGWQFSLISWGLLWTNHRKGLYFPWLLVEGRHLVAFWSGYLDLAYLVWSQRRLNSGGLARRLSMQDSGWKNKS